MSVEEAIAEANTYSLGEMFYEEKNQRNITYLTGEPLTYGSLNIYHI